MIPRILEYEEGMVKLTPEALLIPETNRIIAKHGDEGCIVYLSYVYLMAYPDTPYKNLPKEDRRESALADVKETLGDFDEEDELIEPAINRLRSLWESHSSMAADEMEEEVHRWRNYLRDTPMGGDMKDRLVIVDKFEKTVASAANLRKQADNELSLKMKGSNEMGEY